MSKPKKFSYDLGQKLQIDASGEHGLVIGRAEYSGQNDSYLLRYRAGDGRGVEAWWSEDALSAL